MSVRDHGGNIFDAARRLGVPPGEIADFSASINPLGLSDVVRNSIIASIDEIVHYPDLSHDPLKQAIADTHGVPADMITIANGSTELIYNIPTLINGRRALLISPSFSEYAKALAQHDCEAIHFILSPEENFSINLDALDKVMSDGFDALFLCNPGNPTGILYSPTLVEQIHDCCIRHGAILVLDEAFMDFCEESSAIGSIVAKGDSIIMRSMTKFFGIPGLRLGYSLSSPETASLLNSMGGPWSVNSLALAAGTAALHDMEYIRRTREFVGTERQYLLQQISKVPHLKVYNSSANFVLLEITAGTTAARLGRILFEQGILIRDCSNFVGLPPQFFRIAVRTREENSRLLKSLGAALQEAG